MIVSLYWITEGMECLRIVCDVYRAVEFDTPQALLSYDGPFSRLVDSTGSANREFLRKMVLAPRGTTRAMIGSLDVSTEIEASSMPQQERISPPIALVEAILEQTEPENGPQSNLEHERTQSQVVSNATVPDGDLPGEHNDMPVTKCVYPMMM